MLLSAIWPSSIAQSQLWVDLWICAVIPLQLGVHPVWVCGDRSFIVLASASLVYLCSLALRALSLLMAICRASAMDIVMLFFRITILLAGHESQAQLTIHTK